MRSPAWVRTGVEADAAAVVGGRVGRAMVVAAERPGGVRPRAAPAAIVPDLGEHAHAAVGAGRACLDGALGASRHARPHAADLGPRQSVRDVRPGHGHPARP